MVDARFLSLFPLGHGSKEFGMDSHTGLPIVICRGQLRSIEKCTGAIVNVPAVHFSMGPGVKCMGGAKTPPGFEAGDALLCVLRPLRIAAHVPTRIDRSIKTNSQNLYKMYSKSGEIGIGFSSGSQKFLGRTGGPYKMCGGLCPLLFSLSLCVCACLSLSLSVSLSHRTGGCFLHLSPLVANYRFACL